MALSEKNLVLILLYLTKTFSRLLNVFLMLFIMNKFCLNESFKEQDCETSKEWCVNSPLKRETFGALKPHRFVI